MSTSCRCQTQNSNSMRRGRLGMLVTGVDLACEKASGDALASMIVESTPGTLELQARRGGVIEGIASKSPTSNGGGIDLPVVLRSIHVSR